MLGKNIIFSNQIIMESLKVRINDKLNIPHTKHAPHCSKQLNAVLA